MAMDLKQDPPPTNNMAQGISPLASVFYLPNVTAAGHSSLLTQCVPGSASLGGLDTATGRADVSLCCCWCCGRCGPSPLLTDSKGRAPCHDITLGLGDDSLHLIS